MAVPVVAFRVVEPRLRVGEFSEERRHLQKPHAAIAV